MSNVCGSASQIGLKLQCSVLGCRLINYQFVVQASCEERTLPDNICALVGCGEGWICWNHRSLRATGKSFSSSHCRAFGVQGWCYHVVNASSIGRSYNSTRATSHKGQYTDFRTERHETNMMQYTCNTKYSSSHFGGRERGEMNFHSKLYLTQSIQSIIISILVNVLKIFF